MNGSIVRYFIGQVIRIEGILLLLPCLVGLIYREHEATAYFAVAIMCMVVGTLISLRKKKDDVFYLKEGCVTTAMCWIALSVFGCIPFVITGEIPNFIDALFETISGFTTTGASILNDVEALSHTSLMWRSFTHWVGGMGVLVFLLAIIPLTGGSNFNLMKAESPGPTVGKLVPKMRISARILYIIYFVLTVIEMVLLIIAGMPIFDAVTAAFGTAGTGGFGIKNSSIGRYSDTIQWIVTIFMLLFGVNFNAYYLLLLGHFKKIFAIEEVRVYFGIVITSIVIITINIFDSCISVFDAVTKSSFTVASIITTTGYSTVDFDMLPTLSKAILVILMFVGACAGSTGGGIKVSRFIILFKTFVKESNSYIHPRSVKQINMDGKKLDHNTLRATNVYLITFITVFVISTLILSIEGHDLETTFTAVAATINNIGPGLSLVGPTSNFSFFSPLSKIVMMFDMLAGRLELFPLIILLHPGLWKEAIWEKRHYRRNNPNN